MVTPRASAPLGASVVDVCTDPDPWNRYVQQARLATTYHHWNWKAVIEETYHHRTYYLAARVGDGISGVLPLVALKSRLFGHFLVSLPFFNYGGLLADTPEIAQLLLTKAEEIARMIGADHVELRQGDLYDMPWRQACARVSMIVPLPGTPEEYSKSLGGRLRNKIRHAQKHGFECRWGGIELVEKFYDVFAANMHYLGTPVYPVEWFQNVLRLTGKHTRILLLLDAGKAIAGSVITTYRDFVELPWIASVPESRSQYSTVLLYWLALEWAIQNGFKQVDLGRCVPGGGTYQFKRQWKCEEKPLHWYYWIAQGEKMPQLRPDNPRYRFAINVWKKLPLELTKWLGPKIVRSIP